METITFNSQFIKLDYLKELGLSYYKINKLVEQGILTKLNRSTYENTNYSGDYNDFYLANAYINDGVICKLSAAYYYGLSDYVPPYIEVAIQRERKITTLPKWPSINLNYYSNDRIDTGVIEVTDDDGNSFKIFDLEKTVIDIISFRNKVTIEETAKILKNYLNRKDRDLNKLYRYSKKFRCEKILRTYLEVLL